MIKSCACAQIRDWVSAEVEMLRAQAAVVGDVDDVLHQLDKQKVLFLHTIIMSGSIGRHWLTASLASGGYRKLWTQIHDLCLFNFSILADSNAQIRNYQ